MAIIHHFHHVSVKKKSSYTSKPLKRRSLTPTFQKSIGHLCQSDINTKLKPLRHIFASVPLGSLPVPIPIMSEGKGRSIASSAAAFSEGMQARKLWLEETSYEEIAGNGWSMDEKWWKTDGTRRKMMGNDESWWRKWWRKWCKTMKHDGNMLETDGEYGTIHAPQGYLFVHVINRCCCYNGYPRISSRTRPPNAWFH